MKKLLYTFAIVALGLVISCEKDMMDKDADSILVPSQEIISGSDIMSEDQILDLVESILNGTYPTSKLGEKKSSVTGKSVQSLTDYVTVYVFSDDNFSYLALTDETNDDLCTDSVSPFTMFFNNSAGDGSVLTVEAPEGTEQLSLKGDFAGFFTAGLNSLSRTDSEGEKVSLNFDENNVAAFTN